VTIPAVAGVLAGVVATADAVPYVRDVVRGGTRPHRGAWLVWSVLAIVACASQRADGASWSLVMAATQAVATTLIFVLALTRGEGGVTRVEMLFVALAGGGVVGWALSDVAVLATACVVAADMIGVGLMLPKTYDDPGSETLVTFVLAALSGVLATVAVGEANVALLLYPLYFAVANGLIAAVIVRRRQHFRRIEDGPVDQVPNPAG
jgi:hypothetical protein